MKNFITTLTLGALAIAMTTPAISAEPIKIGALYSLTGGMSSIDTPSLRGAQLAVKLINDKGKGSKTPVTEKFR